MGIFNAKFYANKVDITEELWHQTEQFASEIK
jgi:hypothetical protein